MRVLCLRDARVVSKREREGSEVGEGGEGSEGRQQAVREAQESSLPFKGRARVGMRLASYAPSLSPEEPIPPPNLPLKGEQLILPKSLGIFTSLPSLHYLPSLASVRSRFDAHAASFNFLMPKLCSTS